MIVKKFQSGGQLAQNARQTGNILRILNVRPENSGVYVCLATNNAGSDQTATVVDVERKFLINFTLSHEIC